MSSIFYIVLTLGAGFAALLYSFWRTVWVQQQDGGNERMQRIGRYIAEGAMAFLKAEYKALSFFVIAVAVLLGFAYSASTTSSPMVAVSFLVGATCSGLAGFLGMRVATKANFRTAQGARKGISTALEVAFAGGSVMGMGVVGLGIIGIGGLFFLYNHIYVGNAEAASVEVLMTKTLNILAGFSLGASSIALFARVGGGIYTKAADVGADLVGKVEAGIPEDHPLNPATIADNVGDNVGDVAGMGADLFESYVGSILSSMVLGTAFIGIFQPIPGYSGTEAVYLPLMIAAFGIACSIIGTFFVRVKEGGDPQKALNLGHLISSVLMIGATIAIVQKMLPPQWSMKDPISSTLVVYTSWGVVFAVGIGLVAGVLVGIVTEHYTGTDKPSTISIVNQSATGAATTVIAGLGVGMMSTMYPMLLIAAATYGAYYFAGLYGIAMAALGMLANTGIQLAVDAYGPISDNAGGIAEMAELPPEVRERTDRLDAVGNTTAAIGKGFAIASAALTALALFAAYMQQTGLTVLNVANPTVMAGVFIGGMLPFVFSALAMGAVGRAARRMITEVRRQFADIPELKAALAVMKKYDGATDKMKPKDRAIFDAADGKAEYAKCVEISTQAAIQEMVLPGLLAVLSPVVMGFLFGVNALGGLLVGATLTGVLMAIFQSNAGGAWDNAKKMVEKGVDVDGVHYKKGSDLHKATVVGDTVGDPLKDTSGPSLNILIKLMSVVGLVIAPLHQLMGILVK